jgi:hypothetical protein
MTMIVYTVPVLPSKLSSDRSSPASFTRNPPDKRLTVTSIFLTSQFHPPSRSNRAGGKPGFQSRRRYTDAIHNRHHGQRDHTGDRSLALNIALWVLQVLLAAVFLAHGWLMVSPPAELVELINAQLGVGLRLFIGVAELLAVAAPLYRLRSALARPWQTAPPPGQHQPLLNSG